MDNFAAFILTHGRPDNVLTDKTLRKCGYTGPIYYVIDNEDKTWMHYRRNFGAHRVLCFDKKRYADGIDEGNNFDNRKVIVHARNASFDLADELGLSHFVQLDDDYNSFLFRLGEGKHVGSVRPSTSASIKNMNHVFSSLIEFFERTAIKTLAISQGGDHLGGFTGLRLSRKAMNFFLCSPRRRFKFIGSINEDVNTYVLKGSQGDVLFTFTGLQLNQEQTQKQAGGMTDIYLQMGTYIKSFSTVLFHPSSARVSMMANNYRRLHHSINWKATTPMIVSERHRNG
jgi:hypothetical protein